MTLSVEAEISTAVGIVGPEALHAVGDVAAARRRRAIHDRRTIVVIVVLRFRRVGPTIETEPETRAAAEIAVMMVVVMAAELHELERRLLRGPTIPTAVLISASTDSVIRVHDR
jgi:hypothetical protein